MTDFNFVPLTPGVPDPNLPGPGKRPRSSMSPTIVLKDGQPWLALGSPGRRHDHHLGRPDAHRYVDRGLPLVDAIAAPRLSSRNGGRGGRAGAAGLAGRRGARGAGPRARSATAEPPEIGAATAIRIYSRHAFTGGGRAGTPRWRLSDGRATGALTPR